MAGYIKGITIQIDGETKGLDAALKKVNSTTRSLQGELKRVENLLKMNPGNTDLIRQKQELLKSSISETKLKSLTAEQTRFNIRSSKIGQAAAQTGLNVVIARGRMII